MIPPRAAKVLGSLGITGLIGLSIVLVLNIIARFILKQPESEFFSESWWATWFNAYSIWLVLLIIDFSSVKRTEAKVLTTRFLPRERE